MKIRITKFSLGKTPPRLAWVEVPLESDPDSLVLNTCIQFASDDDAYLKLHIIPKSGNRYPIVMDQFNIRLNLRLHFAMQDQVPSATHLRISFLNKNAIDIPRIRPLGTVRSSTTLFDRVVLLWSWGICACVWSFCGCVYLFVGVCVGVGVGVGGVFLLCMCVVVVVVFLCVCFCVCVCVCVCVFLFFILFYFVPSLA
jgi:hypothetical protein